MKHHDLIVIGTSAGGFDALTRLLSDLPAVLPAAVLAVVHISSDMATNVLCKTLQRVTHLKCRVAAEGDEISHGHLYIAPANRHMLVKDGHIHITKGPHENRSRPAIDPLFRSAARHYNSRVVGVVLTGMLEDGTGGLGAIKMCGGITVVQDPEDAAFPGMPLSAITNQDIDYVLKLEEIPALLQRLAGREVQEAEVPEEVRKEVEIAERVLTGIPVQASLGEPAPYTCPDCGGVLVVKKDGGVDTYHCHTGHTFTPGTLQLLQTENIEETLWVTLRMLEERRHLLNTLAGQSERSGNQRMARLQQEKAGETIVHIGRIRSILFSDLEPLPQDARSGGNGPESPPA